VSSSSSEEASDGYVERKKPRRKRNRGSSEEEVTITKRRKSELRKNMTKLQKDHLIDLVCDTVWSDTGVFIELEEVVAEGVNQKSKNK